MNIKRQSHVEYTFAIFLDFDSQFFNSFLSKYKKCVSEICIFFKTYGNMFLLQQMLYYMFIPNLNGSGGIQF